MKTVKYFLRLVFLFNIIGFLTLPSLNADINLCPGETISGLNGATAPAYATINDTISGYTTHYYNFTPAVDGTIQVNSSMGAYSNSLYIIDGCSTTLWSDTDNSNEKSSSTIDVNAGQQIVIAYERRHSTSQAYTLVFTFSDGTETTGGRDFVQRTQTSLFGDVKVIGNTVLCILSGGVCVEPTTTASNAGTNLQKAPISYSTLTLPTNATVEYARIYWQGRKNDNETWDSTSKTDAGVIGIRKGSAGVFTSLTADIKDYDTTDGIPIYSASADASSVVNGSGTYYIDTTNFYTITGDTPDGLGAYGAWTLVVIYKDPDEASARNITIFDGYKQVTKYTGNIDISVSGFLTPKAGSVDSKTYVFTGEGDKYITGDVIRMAGATYNTALQDIGTFDSRVDVDGTRSPNLTNNNGIDIHKYDTGTTSGARNIITNDEIGAKFQFTSIGDTYFPSLIVFSTELYLPQMCYDYSIKQDGSYLSVDRDAYPVAHLDSTVSSSDLEIVVYLRNQEADIVAEGIALKADVNDTIFDQTGNIYTSNVNGSALIDRGPPTFTDPLCEYDENGDNSLANNGCTNGHDIRKGNGSLDAGDYIFTKYKLSPKNITGLGELEEPLGLSLRYYITAGGKEIVYPDYLLGGENIPLCPPTAFYTPAWGQFNVVQSGQANDDIKNNLLTQISRNPFNTSVVFDSTPTTGNNEAPISNVNTTVLAEIIDVDAFGDLNASCSNPDSSLSEPIFVPINFTPSNYQADITPQSADYYNFAVKNAAFRVWYFNDQNGTLIQDWSASTTNSNKTLLSISGLYKSDVHTQCSVECSDSTSTTCFTCIKNNYAQPLCSRDNFSIRPESYDLRIYDVDKLLPDYNIITDPSNPKNTTKIDLSTQVGYTPTTTPAGRMNLAAGYNYRFDITATGHDGLSSVKGYTRYFNGASDYKATMFWDPQSTKTGCNNISDENIPFYVANGVMQNEERLLSEVGEYRLNITDTSWTAVDWQNMAHHDTSVSGGFASGDDCITGSTSSTLVGGRYGCEIRTDHGSDEGGRVYKDHDLTFHPYRFDLDSIAPSRGENNSTDFSGNPFIYMSNVLLNEEMSLHLVGPVTALGEDNSTLSNFVDNCYAKPVALTLNKSAISGATNYRYRYHNGDGLPLTDQNGTMNNPAGTITLGTNDFNQSNSGAANTILNLNFDRNVTNVLNPERITFSAYDANCSTPTDCTMNADLVADKTTQGTINLDLNLTHLYGRTHASRQRYDGNTGTANIYFESYCFGTVGGNTCDRALLPNGVNSRRVDDVRWFINDNHNIANDGNVSIVVQRGGANVPADTVVATDNPIGNPSVTTLDYDGSRGYPYKTTMENNASLWLIYNESNPFANRNEFQVEFDNVGDWTGESETDTTTRSVGGATTNRRLMW
ncbi:MAG: hypothetical protein WCY51_05985 [Sulfurimonas sp.]|uniref:hypothetical protein n=1 Tax=Sulfurimonas sp. TaxID=2022749 RepID=UPI0025EC82DD|nr:hypothetical protein [Sulfurimonas sp.]MCK9455172.1 hypothetical protein [Sulfurimonas sp.]